MEDRREPAQPIDPILAQVISIARRHGVDPAEVTEVRGGVANRGFALGEKLFLRVSRPGFEADLRKESIVIPVAYSAGVLTPRIIEYDESRTVVDAPYVVMERVHGSEPIEVPSGLGEELARLHGAEQVTIPELGEDDWDNPWQSVEDLAEQGYLDVGTAQWLNAWFTRLAGRFDRGEPKVLIHGDVASHNLLATPSGELAALIDWGDAVRAPRAQEFAKLPLEQVAAILPRYIRHARSSDPSGHSATREAELAAQAVWFHLYWSLTRLPSDPWPGQRHWTAPPASRLLGLLRFFASAPPAPWSTLT